MDFERQRKSEKNLWISLVQDVPPLLVYFLFELSKVELVIDGVIDVIDVS